MVPSYKPGRGGCRGRESLSARQAEVLEVAAGSPNREGRPLRQGAQHRRRVH